MTSLSPSARLLLLSCLAALAPGGLSGQESATFLNEWKWADFPTEDLPAGQVEQMVEAGGVTWLRTVEGVAFHDEFQWIRLDESRGFPAGEVDGNVTSLSGDGAAGVLLVAGGSVFRGDTAGVRAVVRDGDLSGRVIQRALPDPGGGLFLTASREGQDDGRAFLFSAGNLRPVEPRESITGEGRHAWYTDSGSIWINSYGGLARWTGSDWEMMETSLSLHREYQEVQLLFENSDGRGFAFRDQPFAMKGLLAWDAETPPTLLSSEGRNDLLCGDVLEDGSAIMIWETGHVRFQENGLWRTVMLPNQRTQGLYFAHASSNGDLWLASALGLHWFRAASLDRWRQWWSEFPEPRNRVNAMLPMPDGTLWAGSEVGVSHYVQGDAPESFEILGPWARPVITDLARDSAGGIWAVSGLSFPGAFRWDGREWTHLGEEKGLLAGTIHSVEVDSQGSVWFMALGGGMGAMGVYRLTGDSVSRWMDPERFLASEAYTMAEGREGDLWFGTRLGLARFQGGEWSYWGVEEGVGLNRRPYVQDLAVDGQGRVWFTHGPDFPAGLGTLSQGGEIRYLSQEAGLPADILRAVEVDPAGRIWVSSPGGVAFLQDGFWNVIDGRHGLTPPSVWPMAWWNEEILLGTLGGGIRGLSLEEAANPPPRVEVASTMVDEVAARVNWRVFPFRSEIPEAQALTRFRLDDGAWSPWSRESGATFRGASPGPHVVEIQARGLFGQLTPEGVLAEFEVPFPLYRRPAFAVPVGILLALLFGGIIAGGVRKRRHDEALRESEERLRTLVESAPEAIAIYDADAAHFIEANENAGRLFGMEKDVLLSAPPEVLSPETQPHGRPSLEAAIELLDEASAGASPVKRWDVLRSDGTVVPCELSVVGLPWRDRRLFRFSLVDISQRMEAEERRKELEGRLFQSQKLEAVGQLTGGVAHDFNNLLTVILGNLELLQDDLPPDSPLRESAQGASDAAERGALLTQRLLAFSRRQALEPQRVRVDELISGLLSLLQRTLGEDVAVETVFPHDLWPIMADPAQLESAVLNLAINARDAMPRGGRLIIEALNTRVEPEGSGQDLEPGEYLVVAVSDTGTGMNAEVASRAFDPFFTTKEVGKGSGLGLSMVYGFAAQSGGTARIYSEEGIGTTVRLYFPRIGTEEGIPSSTDAAHVLREGRGERVLVLEDEPQVQKTTATLLARLGYATVCAATGEEALALLSNNGEAIDLLFSDIVLPGGMNGVEVAREARRLRPNLPVLFTSGYTEESVLREGRLDPEFELVSKPFSRLILSQRIREVLEGRG